jgi:hypothetical protein
LCVQQPHEEKVTWSTTREIGHGVNHATKALTNQRSYVQSKQFF